MSLSGILPVNKPEGLRSTTCVQKIRSILGRRVKTGHGGTLDSTASGLLLVLVGQCTRLSGFVMDLPKCYETEVAFGASTDTDDGSGQITARAPWEHITNSSIDSALCGFMGWRMQSPPAVSAVHVAGVRSHELARKGMSVVPQPKPVCFLDIARISSIDGSGCVKFRVLCRKGTYIRSFARDLGIRLGSLAHVNTLARISSGPFKAYSSRGAAELFDMPRDVLARELVTFARLREMFECYEADSAAYERLSHGQSVMLSELARGGGGFAVPISGGKVIVASNRIFSICTPERSRGTLELSPAVNIIINGGSE